LEASYRVIATALDVLEGEACMRNLHPKCEPQLGKRGLYASIGGEAAGAGQAMALLWVLNLSDGTHSLLDIAERAGLPFAVIREAARRLEQQALLERA
jgi:aminopeptidase-like protein